METKFGGYGFSGFGYFAPCSFAFKTTKISLQTRDPMNVGVGVGVGVGVDPMKVGVVGVGVIVG